MTSDTKLGSEFVRFLFSSGALLFGDFTLKSGRKAPYFVNAGKFNDGKKISELGRFYAAKLKEVGLLQSSVVFGPAYKGIPLAVSTAIALERFHGVSIGYAFDRKELKDHGDKGKFVGSSIEDGSRVVIVEDVITAGTTLAEIVPLLRSLGDVQIAGVIIAVDRCEKLSGTTSARRQMENDLKIKIHPIITIHDIIAELEGGLAKKIANSGNLVASMKKYLLEFGAGE